MTITKRSKAFQSHLSQKLKASRISATFSFTERNEVLMPQALFVLNSGAAQEAGLSGGVNTHTVYRVLLTRLDSHSFLSFFSPLVISHLSEVRATMLGRKLPQMAPSSFIHPFIFPPFTETLLCARQK